MPKDADVIDGGTDAAAGAPDAGPTTYLLTYGGEAGYEGIADLLPAEDGLVVIGTLGSDASFGPFPLNNEGGNDFIVAKVDDVGAPQWAMSYGSRDADDIVGGALDQDGNIIVAGEFGGTSNYGGDDLASAGSYDLFLVKYSGLTGEHLWSVGYGGSSAERPLAMAVDDAGDIYVTGFFAGTGNVGGPNMTSAGLDDVFVAKYRGSDGAFVWGSRYGAGANDIGDQIAVDGTRVIVSGRFRNTVNFGGDDLVGVGQDDIFLTAYATDTGAHVWSKRFGGALNDSTSDLETRAGSLYVTGFFNGLVSFGGPAYSSQGEGDIYIAKYDGATGAHIWSKPFGTPRAEVASRVLARDDNVVLTGYFRVTVNFGGGELSSAGGSDIFVAELAAADGGYVSAYRIGGTLNDSGGALATSTSGTIVGGGFQGVVYFGSIQATGSGEKSDAFVFRP
jgi:hypothetical protein